MHQFVGYSYLQQGSSSAVVFMGSPRLVSWHVIRIQVSLSHARCTCDLTTVLASPGRVVTQSLPRLLEPAGQSAGYSPVMPEGIWDHTEEFWKGTANCNYVFLRGEQKIDRDLLCGYINYLVDVQLLTVLGSAKLTAHAG